MKGNTPPSSEADFDEEIDIGDIEEIIEINDEDELEQVLDEFSMEQEQYESDEEMGEVEEMASVIFDKHTKSVFCCALSPDGDLAVTGGEDDVAYAWDPNTGNVIYTCDGHKDSVIAAEFSFNGKFLATADMSGYIQVWDTKSGQKKWEVDDIGDINWIKWHPKCNVIVGGTSEGGIWKWLVPEGPHYSQMFGLNGISTQCGALSCDGSKVIVGYEDGSSRVFDLKDGKCIYTVKDSLAHQAPITCIYPYSEAPSMYLSSSMDGTIKVHNFEKDKPMQTIDCAFTPPNQETESSNNSEEVCHSVEVVSLMPSNQTIAVTSTLTGVITIWHLPSQVARSHIVEGCGASQILWHPTETKFFTSGLDGILRYYDALTGNPIAKYTGHRKSLLSASVSRDGTSILTTSDDSTARLFRL